MFLHSLRGKIFLAVLGLLLVIAGAVMPVTQRDMTRTVEANERHAVQNVLQLVLRHTEVRWETLLDDKIYNVRTGRAQLMELGATIQSVLSSYESKAQLGVLSDKDAKQLALAWLNRLPLGERRYAFLYDARHQVLASSSPAMIDQDISSLQDIKGRPLAQALYEESRYSGYGFALYRWPADPAKGPKETRYAYFSYFQPWNWMLAVSDNAQGITNQVQAQQTRMEAALRNALSGLTLAQSGFLFIMTDSGRFVVPPPAEHAELLQAPEQTSGRALQDILLTPAAEQQITVQPKGHQPWSIHTLYYKPLKWTLGAAVPQSDLTAPARRLIQRQAMIFAGALLLALALAWLMASRIAKPLDTLTRYALKLPSQDLTTHVQPPERITQMPTRYRDEVGRLAASFLSMQDKLSNNIKHLMLETSARERFKSELNIARDIQMGMLPKPLPAETLGDIDLHAAIQPAKEVGGDLYDYFFLPDGRLCFAIGDVSDKGVPAALFMAVTHTLIRATAEDETDPAMLLQRINNRLAENNPNMMFVTLLLGVIDLSTGSLVWANAGHPPPALIRADGAVDLLTGRSGPACGVQEDLHYQCFTCQLDRGETLLGYTDGITDATDRQETQYGESRMIARLSAPVTSATTLTQGLLDDVHQFTDGASPFDDITLIAIRRPYA